MYQSGQTADKVGQTVVRRDIFWQCIEKCMESIPTKSIESSVQPLAEQMAALLRHRGPASSSSMTSLSSSTTRAFTTDQAVHVVSKAVTTFVRAGRTVANDNPSIQPEMETACDDAVMAGESLCRVLTARSTYSHQFGISPSTSSGTSQNGTDSGVDEDLDDDISYDVFQLSLNEADPTTSSRITPSRDTSSSSFASACGRLEKHADISASPSEFAVNSNFGNYPSSASLRLPSCQSDEEINQSNLATSCYALLASVIQVLTLADSILVDEIMQCKNEVCNALDYLLECKHFHAFLEKFSAFGKTMDLRSDLLRTQMAFTRSALEKGTPALLETSKVWFHFPSSRSKALRNHAFRRMKRALYRLQQITCTNTRWRQKGTCKTSEFFARFSAEDFDLDPSDDSAFILIRRLQTLLRRLASPSNSCYDLSSNCFPDHSDGVDDLSKKIVDCVEEFTNSPCAEHSQRIKIFGACSMFRDALDCCLQCRRKVQDKNREESLKMFEKVCRELKTTLRDAAMLQSSNITKVFTNQNDQQDPANAMLTSVHHLSAQSLDRFSKAASKVFEASKLLAHCFDDEGHVTTAHHVTENLAELSEQVTQSFLLATSLPTQRLPQHLLAELVQQWRSLVTKDLVDLLARAQMENRSNLMVNNSRSPNTKYIGHDVSIDVSDQKTTAARLGLEIKLLANQCRIEMQQLRRNQPSGLYNSLFRHVSEIVDGAWNIFLFTKGEPPLRTTVDFFKASGEICLLSGNIESDIKHISDEQDEIRHNELNHKLDKARDLLSVMREHLQTASRSNAHGKMAVLSKVMVTLQAIKINLEVVSKILVEISTSSLQSMSYSRDSVRKQKQRSKSLTPRRSHNAPRPITTNTCTTPTRRCANSRSEKYQTWDLYGTKITTKSSTSKGTKDQKSRRSSHSRGHAVSTQL